MQRTSSTGYWDLGLDTFTLARFGNRTIVELQWHFLKILSKQRRDGSPEDSTTEFSDELERHTDSHLRVTPVPRRLEDSGYGCRPNRKPQRVGMGEQ